MCLKLLGFVTPPYAKMSYSEERIMNKGEPSGIGESDTVVDNGDNRFREVIRACSLEHDLEVLPHGENTEVWPCLLNFRILLLNEDLDR